MSELADYYRERATEYDAVYDKPERQEDLARLRALLPPLVVAAAVGRPVEWTELTYFWLATVC
jgi:hypothetical protein